MKNDKNRGKEQSIIYSKDVTTGESSQAHQKELYKTEPQRSTQHNQQNKKTDQNISRSPIKPRKPKEETHEIESQRIQKDQKNYGNATVVGNENNEKLSTTNSELNHQDVSINGMNLR